MSSHQITAAILLSLAQPDYPPPQIDGDSLAFELPGLDGKPVASTDERFTGKVVLVDLWGTWCPPCRKAVPFLVELQDRYDDDGLVIVGIAFEFHETAEARRAAIREFADTFKINYLLLDGGGDPDSQLTTALPDIKANHAFPTMVVLGRNGDVAYSKSGFHPDDTESIENEIKSILGE